MIAKRAHKKYTSFYQGVEKAEDLPWHRTEPPLVLTKAIHQRAQKNRALDIGCGAGTFSIYMAKQGFQVTALDFVEKALAMAKNNAALNEVKIDFVQTDVLEWTPTGQFDLILDSGCLHTLPSSQIDKYRQKIESWLVNGGDYILVHFARRGILDWRPMGPRRRTRKELLDVLCGRILEMEHDKQVIELPFPMGPTVELHHFWFRKK